MSPHEHFHFGEEMPYNHMLQMLILVIFVAVWVPDSLFRWSTFLQYYVPLLFHVVLGILILVIGCLFMRWAHKDLFEHDTPKFQTTGIFGRVRHPMYLGTILAYFGITIITLSLLSLIPCAIAIILYDRMATYEERKLEELLGDEYRAYKKRVHKWIPR